MKIINNKKDAIQELKRISTRTNYENNNKINTIVQEILQEVKNYGDMAVQKYTKKSQNPRIFIFKQKRKLSNFNDTNYQEM